MTAKAARPSPQFLATIQPVVLVGGRSTRFGRDKLREPVGCAREPLVQRPIRALRAVFGPRVMLVGECHPAGHRHFGIRARWRHARRVVHRSRGNGSRSRVRHPLAGGAGPDRSCAPLRGDLLARVVAGTQQLPESEGLRTRCRPSHGVLGAGHSFTRVRSECKHARRPAVAERGLKLRRPPGRPAACGAAGSPIAPVTHPHLDAIATKRGYDAASSSSVPERIQGQVHRGAV